MHIFGVVAIVVVLIILTGCDRVLKPTVVVQTEVEYIKAPPLRCPVNTIDVPPLKRYEFKVLPPLSIWGVTHEMIDELYEQGAEGEGGTNLQDYRYLKDYLGNTWWAVEPGHFQNLDMNDIDKLQALKQSRLLVRTLLDCVRNYNKELEQRNESAVTNGDGNGDVE